MPNPWQHVGWVADGLGSVGNRIQGNDRLVCILNLDFVMFFFECYSYSMVRTTGRTVGSLFIVLKLINFKNIIVMLKY